MKGRRSHAIEVMNTNVKNIESLLDSQVVLNKIKFGKTYKAHSTGLTRSPSSHIPLFFWPICFAVAGNIMLESKKTIGLTWEPQLPSLLFGAKSDKSQNVSEGSSSSLVYKPNSELVDGLFVPPNDPKKVNKLLKKQVKDTAGKNWFDMPAPTLTADLKKDLKLIKLRNVIDPKRHYKKGDSKLNTFPKYFQVGTVVEPVSEYFTSRLTKRERKPTLADELLSDQSLKDYRKRKVREIEEKNRPGGVDKWKIKGKSSWKRAKQRRH
ncbi:hypothetical protein QVD17_27726 [Tagetes erecta]|uniref:Fcf2 pre-rRNA processing C-terminal domain-containing protein n=1 Tax=Tagetes erecta TaxID=13708 RepID=A0AAD8KBY3_TARER|nr:hypothetical protein QVD17_27726 [Tagetes erecta]